MNIFVLDHDQRLAAQYHCDKHVVKMPTESGQMLSTALFLHGQEALWKPAHPKHPCTLWAAENRANFDWLVKLGYELCAEYTHRYGKVHGALKAIDYAAQHSHIIPEGQLTNFALAMPDEYKVADTVQSYRNYYIGEKAHIAQWKRDTPDWFSPVYSLACG
jgi:hypothetical protein